VRLRFVVFALLGCGLVAGCARQPELIVMAPTSTPQGAIVPTRAPTEILVSSLTPQDTSTNVPTDVPIQSNTAAATIASTESTFPATQIAIVATTIVPTAAPTNTSAPTNTAVATNTAAPTNTPSPTAVPPTATHTFTSSPQPTNTSSPTAIPPTATVIANSPTPAPTSTPTGETPVFTTQGLAYLNSTSLNPVTLEAFVTADTPVTGSLRNETPTFLYPFQGSSGDVFNLLMETTGSSSDYPLVPRISVIDPKGREIARSLDERDDGQALIRGLTLQEDGTFIIVASRQNGMFGVSEGEFTLTIAEASAGEPQIGTFLTQIPYDFFESGELTGEQPIRAYTFLGSAGDVVTIEMNAETSELDPRIMLTDNLGNPLMLNDDDYSQATFDSRIDHYMLPASGYYTVVANSFGDTLGDFQLLVTLDALGTVQPAYLEAPLDVTNSRSIRADGQSYTDWGAGDIVDDDKNELRLDTLLTFYLPPLPAGVGVSAATLSLTPCRERGEGFSSLGDLSIMIDPYGDVYHDSEDFTRPATGAIEVIAQNTCDNVDITEYVQSAYESGETNLQLRLFFRNAELNGSTDNIGFTPRLFLNFTPAG